MIAFKVGEWAFKTKRHIGKWAALKDINPSRENPRMPNGQLS
jgi:hypothetical protein